MMTREVTCLGKPKYSEAAAKAMAARNDQRLPFKFNAYRCPFCKHWHIGKAKRPERETKVYHRKRIQRRRDVLKQVVGDL